MDPVTIGAIGAAGAGLVSSLWGAHKSASLTKAENAKNRAWEQQKMTSAWQWTVDDMKKAGINPVLMYGNAGGATMAGSTGTADPGDAYAQTGANVGNSLNSAANILQLRKQKAEIENMEANTGLINAQSGKTDADTQYILSNTKKLEKDTLKVIADTDLSKTQKKEAEEKIQYLYEQMEYLNWEIEKAKHENNILKVNEAFAKANAIKDQITGYMDSITGGIMKVGVGTSALSKSPKNMTKVPQNFYTTQNYYGTPY